MKRRGRIPGNSQLTSSANRLSTFPEEVKFKNLGQSLSLAVIIELQPEVINGVLGSPSQVLAP